MYKNNIETIYKGKNAQSQLQKKYFSLNHNFFKYGTIGYKNVL